MSGISPTPTLSSVHFFFLLQIPAKCLDELQWRGELLASQATLAELADVLSRPKFDRVLPHVSRLNALLRFRATVQLVEPTFRISACRDPRDDKFLSLAVSGNADLIISGDDDLLVLHPFRGVEILSPAQYLERFRASAR